MFVVVAVVCSCTHLQFMIINNSKLVHSCSCCFCCCMHFYYFAAASQHCCAFFIVIVVKLLPHFCYFCVGSVVCFAGLPRFPHFSSGNSLCFSCCEAGTIAITTTTNTRINSNCIDADFHCCYCASSCYLCCCFARFIAVLGHCELKKNSLPLRCILHLFS